MGPTHISQQCDYTPGTDSICAIWGNPATCCTTNTGGQIICSGPAGFSTAPTLTDFDDCSAQCVQGGSAPTAQPTAPPTAAPTEPLTAPPTAPVTAPPTDAPGTTPKAGECSLWLTPTLANPAGTVTCEENGVPGVNKGQCMKMQMTGIVAQMCDDMGMGSACAAIDNSKKCCTTSTGGQVICAGTDGGFNTAPAATDFADCATPCSGGPAPPPVTVAPAVKDVFNLLLLLIGVVNPEKLSSDGAFKALVAGIAAALGIDADRVKINKVWTIVTSSRRLQEGAQVGVDADIKNPNGDVTPAAVAAAGPTMTPKLIDALDKAGIDAKVAGVKEQAPPPTATPAPAPAGPDPCGTPIPPSNPCGTPIPQAPSNPCATAAAKFAVHQGAASWQQSVHSASASIFGALAFGLGFVVLGGVARYVRSTMQTRHGVEAKALSQVELAQEGLELASDDDGIDSESGPLIQ